MLQDTLSSPWQLLPDSILLHIFAYLKTEDLIHSSQSCKSWYRVANDEFLWKNLFYNVWKINPLVSRAPSKHSWKDEYKRLKYHVPVVESEILLEHTNQVLHVSFSHNGEMFATCSKDGFVKVWNSGYPATVRHSANMKVHGWKYTQYSQFNESDTLLLVSGVHAGVHTTTGGIFVFSVDGEFTLQSKVMNKPYDIFGTWYNDTYLLSGDLIWMGHLVSSSVLWLNYAYQDTETADKSVVTKMYRFYNKNASSIRTIMIAKCLDGEQVPESLETADEEEPVSIQMESISHARGSMMPCSSPLSSHRSADALYGQSSRVEDTTDGLVSNSSSSYTRRRIRCDTDFDQLNDLGSGILLEDGWKFEEQAFDSDEEEPVGHSQFSDLHDRCSFNLSNSFDKRTVKSQELLGLEDDDTDDGILLDTQDKYLIYTTGSKTYTPHQIGFKRIKPFRFKDKISMCLTEKLAEQRERMLSPATSSPNFLDERSVEHLFDKADHLIDLHGHIIGMALSPDHRYLYVNNRSWPKNYCIDNPVRPPTIAQEIDIHVIDLLTLKEVGTMLRSHRAYTPNDECFFIFLDVSKEYVVSGAEDKYGYLWDRHYGICLSKYPHTDVVNSVAFNPVDQEMLITASDDFSLKIWRSHNRMKELQRNKKIAQATCCT